MAVLAIGGNVVAIAGVGVGAGGADGVLGWICNAADSGAEKTIGAGAGAVGSAVLGETSGGGARTVVAVTDRGGAVRWGDRLGGGIDGDGGWDFFDAVDAGAELGENEDGIGGVGGFYFAEFYCRADGKLAIGCGVAGDDGGIVVVGDSGGGDRVLLGGLAIVGWGD